MASELTLGKVEVIINNPTIWMGHWFSSAQSIAAVCAFWLKLHLEKRALL